MLDVMGLDMVHVCDLDINFQHMLGQPYCYARMVGNGFETAARLSGQCHQLFAELLVSSRHTSSKKHLYPDGTVLGCASCVSADICASGRRNVELLRGLHSSQS